MNPPTPISGPRAAQTASRRPTPSGRSILRRETLGFGAIIAGIWIAEIIYLPHLLFGEPAVFSWSRILLRTLVVALIWAWVHFTNRRLIRRLHELEGFLLVCSWCRKVGHNDQWLTMEEYFNSRLATETSHGICPECAARSLATLRLTEPPARPPGTQP